MLKKKTIAAALACALALGAFSGSALAVPVVVDGVHWNTDDPVDLQIDALGFRETEVDAVGEVLHGYGKIGGINSTLDEDVFCPGCDLTFTFQYTVKSIDPGSENVQIVFDQGSIKFFVDDTESFNVLDPDTANSGSLWLSLDGHAAPYTGFTVEGDLYSTVLGTLAEPQHNSDGFGLLDVIGGSAASYIDTNTIDDGIGGLADLSLNSSFQFNPANPPICEGTVCYPITGQGGLTGDSRALTVPEPGALGLLGLGLGGLGLLIWRRRKEAEGRA